MALETHRQRRPPPRLGEPSGGGGGLKLASTANTAQEYLNNCRSFYSCMYCRTHLANHDELVSRSFQGNRSRAYLFNSVVNISCGAPVQRELNTGSHAVADIFCTNCGTTIGWKYEKAYEDSQKYKEGKFIIELVHVVRENRHLELDKRDTFMSLLAQQAGPAIIEQVATTSSFGWIGGPSNHHYKYRSNHHHHHHQGSLSPPPRPYSWSASSQQASGSTSSSSSSSSSSSASPSSSPNNPRTRDARVRYNSSGQYEDTMVVDQDEDGDQDEPEHEEALMFPFYDDLYGNRSSYSNLSTSLSYFQRRLRRSLQLASAPLQPLPPYDDWKQQAHRSAPPPSPPGITCSPGSMNSNRISSIADGPSTSAGATAAAAAAAAEQSDNDHQHATSGEIQFELEQERGSLPSSNCDRSHQGDASTGNGEHVATTTTTSQDEEEFYDCCTDHDVA